MGSQEDQLIKLAIAVVLILPALLLVWGYRRSRRRATTWVTAPATVTRVWTSTASADGRGAVASAAYEFRGPRGEVVTGEDVTETRHEVGDTIEVRFDPERPSKSATGLSSLREWHLLGLPAAAVLIVLGLVVLADGTSLIDLGWDVSGS